MAPGTGPDVSIWALTACPATERGRAPLFLEFLWPLVSEALRPGCPSLLAGVSACTRPPVAGRLGTELTWILPGTPVLSIRLATLTVFPQMSYCGRRAPITPATTGPTFMPGRQPTAMWGSWGRFQGQCCPFPVENPWGVLVQRP